MDRIYLDNNATTRPTPEVCAAVNEAHEQLWANPSSVHRFGQQVRQRVELARASVAKLIGAKPREVVFTSGGTEANDLAIRGWMAAQGGGARHTGTELPEPGEGGLSGATLVTTRAEHAAVGEVAEAVERAGGAVAWLPLLDGGVVDVEALGEVLGAGGEIGDLRAEARTPRSGGGVLVSVQWANNETGVVQPIAEIAAVVEAARQRGRAVWLHTDATQAVGKLPVDVHGQSGDMRADARAPLGARVDLLSFAGHKFHGPKGVGGLWIRRGVGLRAQQLGGPQEMEKRGGTENVPGVLGMGVAAEQAGALVMDAARVEALRGLRDRLEAKVKQGLADRRTEARTPPETPRELSPEASVDVVVNSGEVERLWNTSNLGFRGMEAEAILLGLSERGVCASAGAACSSGSLEPSPVLRALGVEEAVAHGSVRLSLSRFTTADEVDAAAAALVAVVGRLARVMPI